MSLLYSLKNIYPLELYRVVGNAWFMCKPTNVVFFLCDSCALHSPLCFLQAKLLEFVNILIGIPVWNNHRNDTNGDFKFPLFKNHMYIFFSQISYNLDDVLILYSSRWALTITVRKNLNSFYGSEYKYFKSRVLWKNSQLSFAHVLINGQVSTAEYPTRCK